MHKVYEFSWWGRTKWCLGEEVLMVAETMEVVSIKQKSIESLVGAVLVTIMIMWE
jgi:hypothetical protein